MLKELTKVNIMGKRPQVGILKVTIGSYNNFKLVCMFGLGRGRLGIDSALLVASLNFKLKRI